ncbi:hypothetical protein J23TS9_45380 [Paenibacillus sp. J23TS9]|nr:hypothetical protein J23TS9_45380 [Paenibacillus sp. J23TS9]
MQPGPTNLATQGYLLGVTSSKCLELTKGKTPSSVDSGGFFNFISLALPLIYLVYQSRLHLG